MHRVKTDEFKIYNGIKYRLWLYRCQLCDKEFKSHMKRAVFCSISCGSKNTIVNRRKQLGIPNTIPENKKWCNFCNRILPLDAFYPSQLKKKKRYSIRCKRCYNIKGSQTRYGITEEQYNTLFEKQNWLCGICGGSLKEGFNHPEKISLKNQHINISIDHIVPGIEDINNYQIVHHDCNLYKQHRTMEELYVWCQQVLDYRDQIFSGLEIIESAGDG